MLWSWFNGQIGGTWVMATSLGLRWAEKVGDFVRLQSCCISDCLHSLRMKDGCLVYESMPLGKAACKNMWSLLQLIFPKVWTYSVCLSTDKVLSFACWQFWKLQHSARLIVRITCRNFLTWNWLERFPSVVKVNWTHLYSVDLSMCSCFSRQKKRASVLHTVVNLGCSTWGRWLSVAGKVMHPGSISVSSV